MKEEFLRFISKKNLCSLKDKILLAVSCGVDSMVMLELFHESGFKISVAHCNFQLRGNESDGDERLVKSICEKHSIPFFSKRFETNQFAEKNSLSIQMAARELRYQWFNELIEKDGFDFVATAHHLNDSIETAILNFARGSGLEGLDGITDKNGKVIRPLLFATREQIKSYALKNKIDWREDSSNASDDYQRNFVRHKIIPLLKEINPSLENSFEDSVEKISGAIHLIDLGTLQWKEKFQSNKKDQVHLLKKGVSSTGLLWNLIRQFGFNIDQCKQIVESLNGQSGKKFFSKEFELIIDREHLIISEIENELGEVLIEKGQGEATLGKRVLKITSVKEIKIESESDVAVLDADKLTFPLRWRKWKAGDYFHPLGMNHKKKLSDFFIDQKISISDKEKITVIESGNEIVWVIGYRIDERFKISEKTSAQIIFELQQS
ncbi:MAG: tRNA lysidine(34) synthetase TilS [Cyclobacteriaceae bacterium]